MILEGNAEKIIVHALTHEIRHRPRLQRCFGQTVLREISIISYSARSWVAMPSCAGTVQESTATGSEREESNVGTEFSTGSGSRKWKDVVVRTARHRETERADARKDLVL
jgi:hypothetical protein